MSYFRKILLPRRFALVECLLSSTNLFVPLSVPLNKFVLYIKFCLKFKILAYAKGILRPGIQSILKLTQPFFLQNFDDTVKSPTSGHHLCIRKVSVSWKCLIGKFLWDFYRSWEKKKVSANQSECTLIWDFTVVSLAWMNEHTFFKSISISPMLILF